MTPCSIVDSLPQIPIIIYISVRPIRIGIGSAKNKYRLVSVLITLLIVFLHIKREGENYEEHFELSFQKIEALF